MMNWNRPAPARTIGPGERGKTPTLPAVHKVGRNDTCPCGSGAKFKRCCGDPLRAGRPSPCPPQSEKDPEGVLIGFRSALLSSRLLQDLKERRGLTDAVIERFELGCWGNRLVFPVRGRDGQILGFKTHKGPHLKPDGTQATKGEGVPAQLYPYCHLETDPLWLTEGEPDVWRLAVEGVQAVTGTAGAECFRDEWAEEFRGKNVVVARDNDGAGEDGKAKAVQALRGVVRRLRVVEWPAGLPVGFDLSDWLNSGRKLEELPLCEVELNGHQGNEPAPDKLHTSPPSPQEGHSPAYGRAALQGEAEKVRQALPGQQEPTLNAAALKLGELVGAGALDHCEALAALVEAGGQMRNEEGRPPWTVEQVRKKVEHGLADGMKQPRQVPTETNGHPSVSSVSASPGESANFEWPQPQPLPDALPPVEPFEPKLLPEAFRPWIEDIAERMQCPPDFPAVGSMVALAAVVGRQLAIRPKLADDWTVVPNLWGAVVGRPGLLKTPALQEVRRPLDRLEAQAREQFDQEMKDFEAEALVVEAQQKNTKAQLLKALRSGQDPHPIARTAAGTAGEAPRRRRYLVHDPTVEKLGEILRDNPRGVLLFRDELTGFLRTMDRDGREGDRAFYLESWNGNSRYSYDRVGRGNIDIEAACVSILGGIQPGPFSIYVSRAAMGGGGDDGLVQRFQLVVWPDLIGAWVNVDRLPNTEARQKAYGVFERLDGLDPGNVGAEIPEEGGFPFLRFTPAAQEVFTEWRTELEKRLRDGDLHPMMESYLSKLRSLIPSLALLIHLADEGRGPVGEAALSRACAWGEYLESHARRVYAPALAPATGAVSALAGRILRGDLKREFALRDVQRHQWSGLSSGEELKKGLELLEALDWIRTIEEPTPGRPRTRYVVNPRLFEGR